MGTDCSKDSTNGDKGTRDDKTNTEQKGASSTKTETDTETEEKKTEINDNDNNSNNKMKYNAMVIGGSGSVGRALVNKLIKSNQCSNIYLLNRKQDIKDFVKESKVKQYIVNMTSFETETNDILSKLCKEDGINIDAGFITMGVGAPSKSDYDTLYKVDVTLPTQFANALKTNDIKHVSLLTSVGSNINKNKDWLGTSAGGGWYLHCKGEIEDNIIKLGFNSVGIARPSTLFGSENTPGVAAALTPMVTWALPKKYSGIDINDLAGAMVNHTEYCLLNNDNKNKVDILEGESLFEWVKKQ